MIATADVFPAYAGMIRLMGTEGMDVLCVPRLRGHDPPQFLLVGLGYMCSPPTRG